MAEYSQDHYAVGGLRSACKQCAATAKSKLLHKVCIQCQQNKPAAEYRKNNYAHGGLEAACKQCALEVTKELLHKVCSQCHQDKPAAEYYQMRHASGGLRPACKQCMKAGLHAKQQRSAVSTATHKVCSRCGQDKTAVEFHRDPDGASGLHSACKQCCLVSETSRATLQPAVSCKECTTCKRIKPADQFHLDGRHRSGLQSACKQCQYPHRQRVAKRKLPEKPQAAGRHKTQTCKPASHKHSKQPAGRGIAASPPAGKPTSRPDLTCGLLTWLRAAAASRKSADAGGACNAAGRHTVNSKALAGLKTTPCPEPGECLQLCQGSMQAVHNPPHAYSSKC